MLKTVQKIQLCTAGRVLCAFSSNKKKKKFSAVNLINYELKRAQKVKVRVVAVAVIALDPLLSHSDCKNVRTIGVCVFFFII